MVELRVPSLGESITQAQVGAWLKREGDLVRADEPLVEVESEKATVAVPAPATGVLRRILKATGDTVAVGEVIAEMEADGQAAAAQAPAPPPAKAAAPPAAAVAPPPAFPRPAAPPTPAAPRIEAPAPSPAGVPAPPLRLTPAARRVLAERGLGKADLLRALEGPAPQPAEAPGAGAPPGERERLVPMSPLRRTVARRLLEAQRNAAILTTFNEVDMTRVLALREAHGEAFQKRHGVKLGFMSFFVKASVEALEAFPTVNAEVRGEAILYKDHYDVGVAVGGGKGLVVPVIRDADLLSFAEIEKRLGELAAKARENRITMEDLAGGTFTISNGGIYGSLLSTPILNPPQSGILGMHKIEKRAVAGPGDQVVVRPMMYLALSYDHRIVDGREAVSFLVRVKECIEDPERLLLEV
ncbi:MAG TPA: 2-oxoglutarate dehydrogenase complex dihydrolipoyllysine-residue succinyltransferase [Anaeromyxobacteraceae bacterium]|nr:2-oxoglutarate dehydrogenase complex dihydrolipoyllysine-residue succinyltransferase [Anaeromyxobacteraceae bacterium]